MSVANLPAQLAGADSTHALVSILSRHAGLPVFLDDIQIGVTPLHHYRVAAGEHEFGVRRSDSSSWLASDWIQRVTLAAGDTVTLVAEFYRSYFITSTPYGAEVWREHKLEGTTPLVLRLPEQARTTVEVVMPGYYPRVLELAPPPGEAGLAEPVRHFELVLEKDPAFASRHEQASHARERRRVRYLGLTYLAAGASLAVGVAAIYFKHEADQAYRQYQSYGDPVLRESYYARARRYDRYSGAAFASFQISFALSFYGFLQSMRR
ncbi:MAG: hypothetical protein ONB48_10195 [candidate division KSB1 bacterium]|nr:hypothetical protein [candidate division KSB1 bacterium]MDZ7273858.1 hypothetical protein [candidate division KSB1 bacterium]MDZ7286014.1 hypothetical protein [candidate division KSB1 bacterium]MDZ7299046.1 hypothetical protein [candidate division KSB1 bacterium]MDZ7308812.1 hypothetical protein [candidate division KSB1 bacterium]